MKKLLFLLLLFITVSILLIKRPFSHEQKETIKKNDEVKNAETENKDQQIINTSSENTNENANQETAVLTVYPDDVYNILDFDRRNILSIGEQDEWGHCSIYCLAYAQAILYNRNNIDPYSYYDGEGAVWRWADYKDIALDNPLPVVLQSAYDEISKGIPVLFYVGDSYAKTAGHEEIIREASEHYVLLIGYRLNADYNNLKASDFYAADPASGYKINQDAYTPWVILTDSAPKTINGEYALFTSDDPDLHVPVVKAYIDTSRWDDSVSDPIPALYYRNNPS